MDETTLPHPTEDEMVAWLRAQFDNPVCVCNRCRRPITNGYLCAACSRTETTDRELVEKRVAS